MGFKLFLSAKQIVKINRSSRNILVRWMGITLTNLWIMFQTITKLFKDKKHREIFFMQIFNGKNVHQTTSLTYMDRYPKIFTACQKYFEGKEDIKILSYGCSTGEEVLTLRRYFPNAQIIGVDINKQSLVTCSKL
ncbi:hypothetical protein [Bacillus coreaensis]